MIPIFSIKTHKKSRQYIRKMYPDIYKNDDYRIYENEHDFEPMKTSYVYFI